MPTIGIDSCKECRNAKSDRCAMFTHPVLIRSAAATRIELLSQQTFSASRLPTPWPFLRTLHVTTRLSTCFWSGATLGAAAATNFSATSIASPFIPGFCRPPTFLVPSPTSSSVGHVPVLLSIRRHHYQYVHSCGSRTPSRRFPLRGRYVSTPWAVHPRPSA